MFGVPAQVAPWLVIPVVTAVLTIGLLVFTVLAWRGRFWTLIARVHYSCVTLSAMIFAGWATYWALR
jgi:hypothetical protein